MNIELIESSIISNVHSDAEEKQFLLLLYNLQVRSCEGAKCTVKVGKADCAVSLVQLVEQPEVVSRGFDPRMAHLIGDEVYVFKFIKKL